MDGSVLTAAGIEAIKAALANVEDNLYRYKHFGKPDDVTGNGETFASVIAKLERERDELRKALEA
jgi:hypothetical protein